MNEAGMKQGVRSALGARSQKRLTGKRERASAIPLFTPEHGGPIPRSCVSWKWVQKTDQVHHPGSFWVARVDNSHNAFIVAPKLKPFTRKMGLPEGASDNNREKFLPFNANPRLLVDKEVRRPLPLEPFPISRKKERPFHWVRKTFHMVISRWNCLFKRIWWKRLGTWTWTWTLFLFKHGKSIR